MINKEYLIELESIIKDTLEALEGRDESIHSYLKERYESAQDLKIKTTEILVTADGTASLTDCPFGKDCSVASLYCKLCKDFISLIKLQRLLNVDVQLYNKNH